MHRDTPLTPANTLIAFFAGAALGGVVVALTTPKRGAELRKDLLHLGDKAKDELGEWADATVDTVEGISTAAKEKADNAAGSLIAKAEDVAEKGQKAWKDMAKGPSSAGKDIKDGLTAAANEFRT